MKPPYKAKAGGRREERLHKGDARSRLCPLGRTFFNSKIPRKDVGGGAGANFVLALARAFEPGSVCSGF